MTPSTETVPSRRRFLKQLAVVGALGAGAAGAGRLATSVRSTDRPFDPTTAGSTGRGGNPVVGGDEGPVGRLLPSAVDDRVLVIVDLQGGNDPWSTLVPVASAAGAGLYRDLRPNLALDEDGLLAVDDEVALAPSLARLHRRGVTTVEGVGPVEGDLSHFAMTKRWQAGDVRGDGRYRTGFLGRLIDTVDDGSTLVGVSTAGPSPYLLSTQASALALDGLDSLSNFYPHEWDDHRVWLDGLAAFSAAEADAERPMGGGYQELMDLAAEVGNDHDEVDWDQPILSEGGDLGRQLYLASELVAAQIGVRVIYASLSGFDTHEDHGWRHPNLLGQLDAAVDGFLGRLDHAGLADRALVATITEFGRRPGENGSGLDHGTASTMLVAGPIEPQRLGEPPDLAALDETGNVGVPVGFDRYLASLAEEWLGVEAASVLADDPEPIGLLG